MCTLLKRFLRSTKRNGITSQLVLAQGSDILEINLKYYLVLSPAPAVGKLSVNTGFVVQTGNGLFVLQLIYYWQQGSSSLPVQLR